MLVRPVRADELGRLKELRLRALLDAPAAFGRTHAEETGRDPEEYRGWVIDGATFVLEDAAGWHGLVAMSPDRQDPSSCHLLSMWVDPSYRGQGLANRLVDAGMAWARQRGATAVRLGVVEDNGPAIGLYWRAGFEPTGQREPLRSNPASHIMHMAARLSY